MRANARDFTVGHDNFNFTDMLSGCAIDLGVSARRVIRNHPAERRPRTRGHVWPETKVERLEESVELIQHHARANAHRARFLIEIPDDPVVSGKINHESVANGTARKAGATAARGHGNTSRQRRLNQMRGFDGALWKTNGGGNDLIRRGVRRVKLARAVVELDFAVCRVERRHLLGGKHSHKLSA